MPNVSYITESNFVIDNNYNTDLYKVKSFVRLIDVDKVHISGCTFEMNNDNVFDSDRGIGIETAGASFSVNHHCITGTTPCTEYQLSEFKNLHYGIRCHGGIASSPIIIRNSYFENCSRGIYLLGTYSTEIINNEIIVDGIEDVLTYEHYVTAGIFLDGATGFKVEENEISSVSYPLVTGIVVRRTHANNNELYKNYFSGNLNVAIYPWGENRGETYKTRNIGLRILCNEFDDNMSYYDVRTHKEYNSWAGIAYDQKMSNPSIGKYLPAGNIFTADRNLTPGNNYYYDFDNWQGKILRYYYEDKTAEQYEPLYAGNIYKNPSQYHNTCPSKLTSWNNIGDLYADLATAKVALNSSQTICSIWKDGGDGDLPEDIELIQPWEVYNEFNALLAESPYLSNDALLAIIENLSFTNLMVKLLMIANPQCVNSDEVMDALYNRNPPLPQSYIDEILAEDGSDSQLEILEGNVGADLHAMRMIEEDIKRYYRADTSDTWAKDSLIKFTSRQHNLLDQYELASIYLDYGMYNAMDSCLNDIPNSFDLTSEQSTNHDYYLTLFDVGEYLLSRDDETDSLSQGCVDTLETIAELKKPQLSQMAYSLLKLNNIDYEYEIDIPLPEDHTEIKAIQPGDFVKDKTELQKLKVYPNPAYDFVTVEYRTLHLVYKKLSLYIYGSNGNEVMYRSLKGGNNEELIDLGNLHSGTYLIRLLADGDVLESQKLNIVK
ncbi:MAG: right-handed parallel beta-helix repeat-containing protein [Bacteroidales bacterium]|nr:right-handed parallel beta-helix repeat-containing protein [Bacteroidales bacterium]